MSNRLTRRARGRLALAAAAAACALTSSSAALLPADATAAEGDRSSFLFGVLPDTQFYSRYSADNQGDLFMRRFGSEPFAVQTEWLVDRQDELQIPFVAHLGDVVDRANQTQEWEVADAAMRTLEQGELLYSVLAGNHDVLTSEEDDRNLADELYLRYFPTSRAQGQTSFGGRDSTGFHEWHTFRAEGREFLVLALGWNPSDRAIAWAREVLADNPRLPAILTTHDILNIASDGVTPVETGAGMRLWDGLIRDNDQIFLTLNGHNHGSAHLRKTNDFGHSVDQIVWDYQMAYQGGNAYLGLMEFDFTNRRIDTAVVSPWIRLKPAATIIPEFDQAVKTGPNENLSLPLDWNDRFERFADEQAPQAADHASLIDAARRAVLDGYDEPDTTLPRTPHDASDYPRADGTLAHWRFDAATPGPVAFGAVAARDLAAGADMRRGPQDDENVENVQLGDLAISTDHHALSANPASACFVNGGRRVSYMNTTLGAAVNGVNFVGTGYTIETFVKLDSDWSATTNAWMGGLTREGSRRDVPGMTNPGWSWDEPLFTMAISNLREVQWNASSASPPEDRAAWSGEIMAGRWMHIAVVNDPISATTTLNIDGAPVLRNSINTIGLASGSLPWRIGSSMGARRTANGWFGCIGETRIVDHPLPRDQWLTARTYVAPEPEPEPNPNPNPDPDPNPNPTPNPNPDPPVVPTPTPVVPAPQPQQPGAGAPEAGGPERPAAARVRSIAVRDGSLRVRLSAAGSVRVVLRARVGGRWARRPVRTLTARVGRAGTVTVRLPRSLRAGRYRVEVTATSRGGTTRRSAVVRVARAARSR